VAEKGIDTLLYAVSKATDNVHLLIIGNGPEKESLQLLSRQLGLTDKCRFIDAVAYDLMAGYMNLLDLLVLPSRTTPNWKEQFGRVLVEAMACKVAVAGSNSGAIPEVIGNPEAIFLEGDAYALNQIITMLATNLPLRQKWSEQGYERVMQNYTIEKLAQKISHVWQTLVN
jgi:L-malate glycosyltransferase